MTFPEAGADADVTGHVASEVVTELVTGRADEGEPRS